MKTTLLCLSLLFPALLPAQLFCGYPGDANNDGRADYLDLFPVGLAYHAMFLPRPDTSTNWALHCFQAWPQQLPATGVNAGFADADGSGRIDSLDIGAIAANYDSMQSVPAFPEPQPYEPPEITDPCALIRIEFRKDLDDPMKFYADVFLDVDPSVFPGALALGLAMAYDPQPLVDDSTRVLFDPLNADLMGVGAAPMSTSLQRQLPPGRVELAVSGRGGNPLFFPRRLASVQFIITEDVIIRADTIDFSLEILDILMINSEEQRVCLETKIDFIRLILDAGEPAWARDLRVFPNPAGDLLQVSAPVSFRAEIRDVVGSIVATAGADGSIDTARLPAGVYVLVVQSGGRQLARRVVVFH